MLRRVPRGARRSRSPGRVYLVIYDASRDEFGLAGKGTGSDAGTVIGWYGSLRETLQAM